MKIFIVCPRLCYGGAERVAVMLANGLTKRHDVTVVANLNDDISYELNEKIRTLNLVKKTYSKILKYMSSIYLIHQYICKYKPDVIIGIMYSCSFLSKISSLGTGVPVIMTEHDSFDRPESAPFNKWEIFHKFYLNKIYKYITVLTNADKKLINNRFRNVTVMPNPLALSPLSCVPPKEKIILAAGRIDDWHYKGFDVLIKAWGKIACKYPDWILTIVGKDENNSRLYLERLCQEYGVKERTIFGGFRKDIKELYRKSAVFVLSSRYEGFGLVLIEAMSQGCACVAADYKGRQSDIITTEDEGLLCIPDDVESLEEKLDKIISHDDFRHAIQWNAIKASERFSIDKIIKQWEVLLSAVVS